MASAGRIAGRTALIVLLLVVFVVGIGIAYLLHLRIPQNAAGMAAKTVCSSAFVGGRTADATVLMEEDVLPADPALRIIGTTIDEEARSVTSRFLFFISRQASLLPDRGCVLDEEPDPQAQPYVPGEPRPGEWPIGDALSTDGVDTTALQAAIDTAFVGQGDPAAANTRAVAVVQGGRLLALRESDELPPETALHGWSMTKTVAAMLAYKRFTEVGLDLETPVVDAFRPGREPAWVADWRADSRAEITVADLMFMLPGLQDEESYASTGNVVQMLYGEPDMAAYAASKPAEYPAGTHWEYLSATSVLLSAVARGQFDTDEEYWAYPRIALFEPLGLDSATLETDTSGTWVGSSYQWASGADWARLGQLMLDDGSWEGTAVLPPGWLALATTRALPDGDGAGYGAQTWLLGDTVGGECRTYPGVPEDTIAMEGHWGQIVAMVPSREAVLVRLGWTFDRSQFDGCQFVSDMLAALPE
jgi:CubicO group peptidase (beta-lactamase class C family)